VVSEVTTAVLASVLQQRSASEAEAAAQHAVLSQHLMTFSVGLSALTGVVIVVAITPLFMWHSAIATTAASTGMITVESVRASGDPITVVLYNAVMLYHKILHFILYKAAVLQLSIKTISKGHLSHKEHEYAGSD
jgi:hypothetical protein